MVCVHDREDASELFTGLWKCDFQTQEALEPQVLEDIFGNPTLNRRFVEILAIFRPGIFPL